MRQFPSGQLDSKFSMDLPFLSFSITLAQTRWHWRDGLRRTTIGRCCHTKLRE
jgi:hypothetical protein